MKRRSPLVIWLRRHGGLATFIGGGLVWWLSWPLLVPMIGIGWTALIACAVFMALISIASRLTPPPSPKLVEKYKAY